MQFSSATSDGTDTVTTPLGRATMWITFSHSLHLIFIFIDDTKPSGHKAPGYRSFCAVFIASSQNLHMAQIFSPSIERPILLIARRRTSCLNDSSYASQSDWASCF